METEEQITFLNKFQDLKNLEAQQFDILNEYETIYKDYYLKTKKTKKSLVKVSQYEDIYHKNCIIEDIFSDRKENDDLIFLENEILLNHLRRGNTILQINDESFKLISKKILRRGLPKFFLLQPEYVDQLQQTWVSKNQFYKQVKNAMFSNVKKSLQNGNQIKIYKLEKVNGKNAQISFNKELDIWCIASKNMSIVIRKKEDIQQYKSKQELSIVLNISQYWFELLEKLNVQQQKEVKDVLDKCTLMGEFCLKESQHLVDYPETIIKFFAIVLNYSEKACIDPLLTQKILEYFNFPQVSFEQIGIAQNNQELDCLLMQYQQKISQGSLQKDGEGVVLYFVEDNKINGNQQMLNLCKIKSLEYRIFRQLRERIQRAKEETQSIKLIKQFEKDLTGLFKTQSGYHSQNYYCMFGQYVIEQHQQYFQRARKLKFVEFLKLCQQKFKDIKNEKDIKLDQIEDVFFQDKILQEMEEQKVEIKETKFQNFPRIRIVIITPDFYLYRTEQFYNVLKEEFQVQQIYTKWSQNEQVANNFQIRHINQIPGLDIKQLDELNLRTFFLIIGMNDNSYDQTLLNFKETLINEKNKNKQDKEIKKFQKQQQAIIRESQKFIKTLQQFLPNNFKVIDNILKSDNEQSSPQRLVKEIIDIFTIFPLKIQSKETMNKQDITPIFTQPKKIIVLVSVGIPAMGKTFQLKVLTELLQQSNFSEFEVISSDEIRRQCMEYLRKKNPSHSLMSEDELFNKSTKPAKDQFEKQLIEALKNIKGENKIIILDKNHLPNNLPYTIKLIQKSINVGFQSQIIALLPFQTKKLKNYPFSLQFYFTCLQRSIKRESHLTLQGNSYKMANVLTGFLKQFQNQEFNEQFCKQFGFDGSVFLQYHIEDETIQFDKNLVDQFFAMLKIKKLEENSAQLTEFVQNFENIDFEPKNVAVDNIRNQQLLQLEKLGIEFNFKKEEKIEIQQQVEQKTKEIIEETKIN